MTSEGERLQKVLALAGIGSRRASEELIAAGRITINGVVAGLGARADVEIDEVAVDGVPIGVRPGLVHYLVNKPAGVVTTMSDPQGRPTVSAIVPADPLVHPVGRLDSETEGLLLMTNDGTLTHRLTHPSFGVDKEYLAEVNGRISRGALRMLRDGVELDDGPTSPAEASLVDTTATSSVIRLVIHEGRNRQVRRMCDAVGHRVLRLVRTRIGPITDTTLRPGAWRNLRQDEVRALERAVRPEPSQSSERGREQSEF